MKVRVFELGGYIAPRPDGFLFPFTTIVQMLQKKKKVMDFLTELHPRSSLSKHIGSSFINWSPKTTDAMGTKDLRPITLIGSKYKNFCWRSSKRKLCRRFWSWSSRRWRRRETIFTLAEMSRHQISSKHIRWVWHNWFCYWRLWAATCYWIDNQIIVASKSNKRMEADFISNCYFGRVWRDIAIQWQLQDY